MASGTMRWIAERRIPHAYLITFTCYGTRLHGREEGSVDRFHNSFRTDVVGPNRFRWRFERGRQVEAEYFLDAPRRSVVLEAIVELCRERDWTLRAAHIRTNHLHVVVEADALPDLIAVSLKARASRDLKAADIDAGRSRRWTRGASTRYLWTVKQVDAAIRYVLHEQGAPMCVYPAEY